MYKVISDHGKKRQNVTKPIILEARLTVSDRSMQTGNWFRCQVGRHSRDIGPSGYWDMRGLAPLSDLVLWPSSACPSNNSSIARTNTTIISQNTTSPIAPEANQPVPGRLCRPKRSPSENLISHPSISATIVSCGQLISNNRG